MSEKSVGKLPIKTIEGITEVNFSVQSVVDNKYFRVRLWIDDKVAVVNRVVFKFAIDLGLNPDGTWCEWHKTPTEREPHKQEWLRPYFNRIEWDAQVSDATKTKTIKLVKDAWLEHFAKNPNLLLWSRAERLAKDEENLREDIAKKLEELKELENKLALLASEAAGAKIHAENLSK